MIQQVRMDMGILKIHNSQILYSVHIKYHIVLCNIIKDTVITTISLKLLNTVLVW